MLYMNTVYGGAAKVPALAYLLSRCRLFAPKRLEALQRQRSNGAFARMFELVLLSIILLLRAAFLLVDANWRRDIVLRSTLYGLLSVLRYTGT